MNLLRRLRDWLFGREPEIPDEPYIVIFDDPVSSECVDINDHWIPPGPDFCHEPFLPPEDEQHLYDTVSYRDCGGRWVTHWRKRSGGLPEAFTVYDSV